MLGESGDRKETDRSTIGYDRDYKRTGARLINDFQLHREPSLVEGNWRSA